MLPRRSTLPLSALSLLTLAAVPVAAQTKAPGIPSAVPAVPPAADQASAVDLMPLKKALAPLAGNGLLEVQSTLKVNGMIAGSAFTFSENLHILARRGGFFRVEVSPIGVDKITEPKLLVVCDGKHVWTYRPGQRTYSVATRQAFLNSDDEPSTLGTAADIFDHGHDLTGLFRGVTKENNNVALKKMADAGLILTSKAQSIGGKDCTVYQMLFQKQHLSYLFYVDSQTNALERADLIGNNNGMKVTAIETLTLLRVPTSVPANTFTWTPPPGVKKEAGVKGNSI